MHHITEYYNYWIVMLLLIISLYGIISQENLVKKLAALSIFQAAVFLLYISIGNVKGGTSPILKYEITKALAAGGDDPTLYSNPLPHVLILTAIVVGISTLALGLALVIRIKKEFGTIEENEILAQEQDKTISNTQV